MAAVIRALFSAGGFISRAAPVLLAVLLAIASYFTAIRAGIRLWDDSPVGSSSTPDYFVKDFAWVRVREAGAARSQLEGELMTHIPANDLLTLSPVTLSRQRAGQAPLRVHANRAQLSNLQGELRLDGSVRINRPATTQAAALDMQSPRMVIDTDREIIRALDGVAIRQGKRTLNADEVTVRQLSGEMLASGNVRVTLPATDQPDIR